MLALLVEVLRVYSKPDRLDLDNGSTDSGGVLATACTRLGITLLS